MLFQPAKAKDITNSLGEPDSKMLGAGFEVGLFEVFRAGLEG